MNIQVDDDIILSDGFELLHGNIEKNEKEYKDAVKNGEHIGPFDFGFGKIDICWPPIDYEVASYDYGDDKEFALILYSSKGDVKKVRYLIKNGAYIHSHKNMAIRMAQANKHFEIVSLLRNGGLDDIEVSDDEVDVLSKVFEGCD
jgi:hypothetical protein